MMKLSFALSLLLSVALLSSFLRLTMALPNDVASPPPPSPAIPSKHAEPLITHLLYTHTHTHKIKQHWLVHARIYYSIRFLLLLLLIIITD